MKQIALLVVVAFALASVLVAACSKNTESSSTATSSSAAPSSAPAAAKPALPIPLAKLPSATVKPGDPKAGAQVYAANCESCHGAGGKNGQVGPSLAGTGIKAGQVAYMVRNPAAVDKDSAMPALPISDKQVADVAAYVASLK